FEDGAVDFRGRRDSQIKLRGYRVELSEVEAALSFHPGVERAAVVVREDGAAGRRLVAYVATRGPTSSEALREHLRAHLPEYMVPAAIVCLDALPLNPHGKI